MNRTLSKIVSGLCRSLALCAAFVLVGCSTFERDWKRAVSAELPSDGILGRWQGRWLSDANGHNGRLRCIVRPDAEGRPVARFHAKYQRILSFGYTVVLEVQQTNQTHLFRGAADLGWAAGGEYHYEGTVSDGKFAATYSSKQDHGIFEMERPASIP